MTRKHPFTDYEPVKRFDAARPATSESADDENEFVRHKSDIGPDGPEWPSPGSSALLSDTRTDTVAQLDIKSSIGPNREPVQAVGLAQDRGVPETKEEGTEKWILKHGHAVSFAGVF